MFNEISASASEQTAPTACAKSRIALAAISIRNVSAGNYNKDHWQRQR